MRNAISFEETINKLYSGLGWVSFFTKIRFWTGSYVQLERFIPKRGTILDLGCGYGIFATYLALSSKQRRVIGMDTDKAKIRFVNRGVANVRAILGDATKTVENGLSAIVLLDVLHHLESYAQQETLIVACKKMLEKNGRLIISEVDRKPFWKLVLARATDFLLYPWEPVYYGYRVKLFPVLERHFGKSMITVHRFAHNPFPHLVYVCQKK